MTTWSCSARLAVGALLLGACNGAPTAPTGDTPSPSSGVTRLVAVAPQGGATGVSPDVTVAMQFSGPMAGEMEQYVDLHDGTTAGPVHPMSCAWSPDHARLACTPTMPLEAGSTYTLHMGAGLITAAGDTVSMIPGTGMGGQWLMGGMMGGHHADEPMAMMTGDWRGTNGSYGMTFTFSTK